LIKWIKLSWLSIYTGRIYSMVQHFDVAVFSLITGSVFGISYWSVAFAVASIVSHSGAVSEGIYGKLLESDKKEYLQENLRLVIYFAIPLFSFVIVFARPGLFTLNPIYEGAIMVVVFLAIHSLVQTFNNIFDASLKGIEKVDLNEKANFKDYLKSKLFFLPTLTIIQRACYIGTLVVVLLYLLPITDSQLELVVNWAIVAAIVPIPFALYRFHLVRKNFEIKMNFYSITKYIFASIGVFGITYFFLAEFLIYEKEIFVFLPQLLVYVIFSIVSYLLITYLIDKNTRVLVKAIINEVRSIIK